MRFMTAVGEKLDTHTYPATSEELIEAYGEMEFEHENGSETFGEVMGRLGNATYVDSDDARDAAFSVVGEAAIGRKGYSDRDAPTVGEETGYEMLSF